MMRHFLERGVNFISRRVGYQVQRVKPQVDGVDFPADFEKEEIEDFLAVKPHTLTSPERIVSLSRAVRHVVENRIPGDFVECGVWRGGSVMAMLRTLIRLGDTSRHVYLFDTFEGMSTPTPDDVSYDGEVASWTYKRDNEKLIAVDLEEVKKRVLSVGYDASKIHFVKGKVEDTIPGGAPESIALLRLDTDWYESTKHEMNHLYPRLSRGGVIIIDDYGHWKGSKKAVDEYLAEKKIALFLSRIDYTGRLAIKP